MRLGRRTWGGPGGHPIIRQDSPARTMPAIVAPATFAPAGVPAVAVRWVPPETTSTSALDSTRKSTPRSDGEQGLLDPLRDRDHRPQGNYAGQQQGPCRLHTAREISHQRERHHALRQFMDDGTDKDDGTGGGSRLTDGFGIVGVVFSTLAVGHHELGRDHPYRVTHLGNLACPMMGTATGFDANETW